MEALQTQPSQNNDTMAFAECVVQRHTQEMRVGTHTEHGSRKLGTGWVIFEGPKGGGGRGKSRNKRSQRTWLTDNHGRQNNVTQPRA